MYSAWGKVIPNNGPPPSIATSAAPAIVAIAAILA